MSEKKQFTAEGLAALQAELDRRMTVVRKEIVDAIEEARAHGDLSENAEYTEARNLQSENENEIARLEEILRNAELATTSSDHVSVGTKVTVHNSRVDMDITYSIVGGEEADPTVRKISNECPIGRALSDHKVGDKVEVDLPVGLTTFTILNIEPID